MIFRKKPHTHLVTYIMRKNTDGTRCPCFSKKGFYMPSENMTDKGLKDVQISEALAASGLQEPVTEFKDEDIELNSTLESLLERINKLNDRVEEDMLLGRVDLYHMITADDDKEVNSYIKKLQASQKNGNDEAADKSEALRIMSAVKITNDAYKLSHPEKLTFTDKVHFNGGILPARKLSDEELNYLADQIIQIQKDAGIYHCKDPKATEEYRRHQFNRLAKQNENGCARMLRTNIKDYEDEKQRATIIKDLRYAGLHEMRNYTDKLEERYATKNVETAKADMKKGIDEKKIFERPTVEQVKEYAVSAGYPDFDAQKYVDYNNERGWTDKNGKEFYDWQRNVDQWIKNERNREIKQAEGEKAFAENKSEKTDYEKPTKEQAVAYAKENNLSNIDEKYIDKLVAREWKDTKGEDIHNWQAYMTKKNSLAAGAVFVGYTKEQFDKIVKDGNLTNITDKDFEELSKNQWKTKKGENITNLPKYLEIRNSGYQESKLSAGQEQSAGMKLK